MTENNKNEQTIINDLVDAMRRDTTEAQKAYLAGETSPTGKKRFFDWHAAIDRLDLSGGDHPWFSAEMSAQLRAFLHKMVGMTHRVGSRTVSIGKRILEYIFDAIARYPATFAAMVALAAINFLVSGIPLIGWLLAPVANAIGVALVGLVFIGENVHCLKTSLGLNH